MKIVAVVPIKTNNERLPGKNTKLLGGVPLVRHVLRSLIDVSSINERYVFCSDDGVGKHLLPGIAFLERDAALDLPDSNFTQIFESFSKEVCADIYVYAHATAPFVTAETIGGCIDAVKSGKHDSAFCAVKIEP